MKIAAGRKKLTAARGIRTVSDKQLSAARCVAVSRGDCPGHFAVYLETKQGERIRVSHDLSFKAANETKERYLQRRFFLNIETQH